MIRVIATLVGVVASVALCVFVAVTRGEAPVLAASPRGAPVVTTPAPAPTIAPPRWLAVVVPAGEVEVTVPPSGGRIADVLVRLGDRVDAGQVVARLDPERARQGIAEAQARLAAREAERRQAIARKAQARDRLDRIEKLEAIVPQAERTEAELALAVAQADVERTAAESRVQRVAIEQLGATLRDTTIVAPIAAEVSARLLDAGAQVAGGEAIVRLVDGERLFRLAVAPDEATPQPGDAIDVRCSDRDLVAHVTQVAPHVDPAARVVLVEARPDTQTGLRLGDSCTAVPRRSADAR